MYDSNVLSTFQISVLLSCLIFFSLKFGVRNLTLLLHQYLYSNQLLAITLFTFFYHLWVVTKFFDVYMILQWTVIILMLNEQRLLVSMVNFLFISSSYHKQQLLSVSKMRLEFCWFQMIVSTRNLLICVFGQPQLVCMVYGYAILVHSDDTVAYYARLMLWFSLSSFALNSSCTQPWHHVSVF